MNLGAIICLLLCIFFLILGLIFAYLKEKAAILISGFNAKSKEERAKYNTKQLVKDERDNFILWSIVFGIGSLLSFLFSTYLAIAAFVVWLILFFKDVHLDDEKAFGKYRIR